VTITSSVAEYSLASASVSSYAYADGWVVEWALLMPDSVTHTFRAGAALVRTAWHPVVTDADLFRRVSGLNPSNANRITGLSNYQDYIDEAAVEIQRRLAQGGRRPWLVVDTTELREPHLLLTLALVFEDLRSRNNIGWAESARDYRMQFEAAWARAKLSMSWPSDDATATGAKRGPKGSGFWLMSRD
jgi:hypothetical protein